MSSGAPEEGLPSFDQPYPLSLEEVAVRAAQGTLSEVAQPNEGQYLITLPGPAAGSLATPREELAARGATPFQDSLLPGFEGWQPGTVVNARFIVDPHSAEPGLLVCDEDAGDTRRAHHFGLARLNDTEATALATAGISHIDADVTVVRSTRDPNTYEATLRTINSIQQPWDGETELRPGEKALLVGTVVAYEPVSQNGDTAAQRASIHLRLSNGAIVAVPVSGKRLTFDGGTIDCLFRAAPEPGDFVQLNCTFAPLGNSQEASLYAPGARSLYLLQAHPERQRAYDEQRASVARRLEALQSLEGSAFRAAYAELLQAYSSREDPNLRLTSAERAAVTALLDHKFPAAPDGAPSVEGPAVELTETLSAYEVTEGWGVDVYAMSRQELLDFCTEIAIRRFPNLLAIRSNVSAPFHITIGNGFSAATRFELYKTALTHWLPAQLGRQSVTNTSSKPLVDPERQTPSTHVYFTSFLLQEVNDLSSDLPEAKDLLYSLLCDAAHQKLAAEAGALANADSMITGSLCRAFSELVLHAGTYDPHKGWLSIRDPAGLAYLLDKVPTLTNYANQLELQGYTSMARQMRDAVAEIMSFNTLPPYPAPERG